MSEGSGGARYAGIDAVDPRALAVQRTLTDALWSTLVERGVREGQPGRIEVYFRADHEIASASLARAYARKRGWEHEVIRPNDDSGAFTVKVLTPIVALSRDCLLELVDVVMIDAHAHGCVFDGFQLDVSAVGRRPWWRVW